MARSTLYDRYIVRGVLSVGQDRQGRRFVEIAELLRVFGELNGAQAVRTPDTPTDKQRQARTSADDGDGQLVAVLRDQISLLERQLQQAENRERWLRQQIEDVQPKRLPWLARLLA